MTKRIFMIVMIAGLTALVGCRPSPTTAAPTQLAAAEAAVLLATPAVATPVVAGRVAGTLLLATTTSTQDSGLLDVILPVFERKYNVKVKTVAVGTGQAIKLGTDGNADVVLVHARAQEDVFVQAGDGINRRDVMYNDFIIVGPGSDPAHIAGPKSAAEAFKRIAAAQSLFASRGDKSGTNSKELDIWKAASIEPKGAWYLSLGQGMGETLTLSNEKRAYTLTDRATWLSQKSRLSDLNVLVGGNSIEENADQANLFNPYGVIPVNPARHPQVNAELGEKFAQWITSLETQQLIARYGLDKYGQSLFRPSSEAWKRANR